mgnify:CR=1 FL=1
MNDLRDLAADRQLCLAGTTQARIDALAAALDEIERLKGLLVKPSRMGGFYIRQADGRIKNYPDKDSAWAAVRKAANDGK